MSRNHGEGEDNFEVHQLSMNPRLSLALARSMLLGAGVSHQWQQQLQQQQQHDSVVSAAPYTFPEVVSEWKSCQQWILLNRNYIETGYSVILHHSHDWAPYVRTMCLVLRKRNMRNVDKEKHVTRVSADVALTYERTWFRVSYVFFLVGVTHITFMYVATYCSEFGTRFDSNMSVLWDHPILFLLGTAVWRQQVLQRLYQQWPDGICLCNLCSQIYPLFFNSDNFGITHGLWYCSNTDIAGHEGVARLPKFQDIRCYAILSWSFSHARRLMASLSSPKVGCWPSASIIGKTWTASRVASVTLFSVE